ncbi:site-specific DNA-methyltransferase, partial [Streptococcus suis]
FEEFIADNRIWFGDKGDNVPRIKRFLSEVKNTVTQMTIWKYADVGHSQSARQDLKKLFDGKAYFTYPKPVQLMKQIVQLYSEKDG